MIPDRGEITRAEFDMLREQVKELHKIYEIVRQTASATEALALELKYMREKHQEYDKRLDELEAKPVKRYDTIVTTIITSIISLIIGFIAASIGFK